MLARVNALAVVGQTNAFVEARLRKWYVPARKATRAPL